MEDLVLGRGVEEEGDGESGLEPQRDQEEDDDDEEEEEGVVLFSDSGFDVG